MNTTGKQRYVSTSFWDDQWIMELDPSEKLLYLYFMTNPLTNIAGVYKIAERRVAFDTGFNVHTIRHIMDKFQAAGKAFRSGEYLIIPSWPKHQKWEKAPRIRDGIMACLLDLPVEVLNLLAEVGYCFDLKPVFDSLSIPYPYPLKGYTNPSSYSDSDLDLEFDSETDSDLDPPVPPAPVDEVPPRGEPDPFLQPPGNSSGFTDYRQGESPEDPRPEARELAAAWYQEYCKRTARVISPNEKDIQAAWSLLEQTDLKTALEGIPIYFECTAWFMYDKGKKHRRFSFPGFCSHFVELGEATVFDPAEIVPARF